MDHAVIAGCPCPDDARGLDPESRRNIALASVPDAKPLETEGDRFSFSSVSLRLILLTRLAWTSPPPTLRDHGLHLRLQDLTQSPHLRSLQCTIVRDLDTKFFLNNGLPPTPLTWRFSRSAARAIFRWFRRIA